MRIILALVISLVPYLHIHFSDYEIHYDNMEYSDMQIEINGVNATMYHNSDTSIFASGIQRKNIKSYNYYIAISRDLHVRYGGFLNFYDTVLITNSGHKSNKKYIVIDLMNEKWKKKIDFLEPKLTSIYRYKDVQLIYKFKEKI